MELLLVGAMWLLRAQVSAVEVNSVTILSCNPAWHEIVFNTPLSDYFSENDKFHIAHDNQM